MQIRDFIVRNAIIGDLQSITKNESLAEMVDALIAADAIAKDLRQGVLTALLDRERLGSTGIGQGIAIPHAKHPGIKKLIGLFARSREGVQFDAIDGEAVHLFFLLLSNQEHTAQHLEALAYVSRHLRDELFCKVLLRARDEREILEFLEDADQKVLEGG